jgi:negative regulator of replication initiation
MGEFFVLTSKDFSMKTKTQRRFLASLALASAFSLQPSAFVQATTTINAANKYAYAANLGWMDWRGDTNSGAVIGE